MEMIQIDLNYSAGNKSTAIFFSIFYFFFPFNFKVVNYNFFRLLFLFFCVCARNIGVPSSGRNTRRDARWK